MNIKEFMKIVPFKERPDYLKFCTSQIQNDGLILEFGVFKGRSIKVIANAIPNQCVYGFDSFDGLPEDWTINNDRVFKKGAFIYHKLPQVPKNVTLIKGLFEDTLEPWLKKHNENISFLHIDCDLYSSTKYVLDTLNNNIKLGTVIMFDELCDWVGDFGYTKWQDGEWKALNEWMKTYNRKAEAIARTDYVQGAIKITK